ncbi:MAG: hypothetical protein ACRD1H_15535, partial [Vicinamibacterales bacterium]
PTTQRDRLVDWGFTGAVERQFEIPSSSGEPAGMTLLAVLVVEFRSPEGARAAVEAGHADAKAAEDVDISDVVIDPLGDYTAAASGSVTIEGESMRVAYVLIQIGRRAITFAGGSPAEDPLAAIVDIAGRTVGRW